MMSWFRRMVVCFWVSSMASRFGKDIAAQASNAHENNADALDKISDPYRHRFTKEETADEAIDLLNNQIALELADSIPPESNMNDITRLVLEEYHRNGFHVAQNNPDGTYSIVWHRLDDETYERALNNLDSLNKRGFKKGVSVMTGEKYGSVL